MEEKLISDYTKLSFLELEDLNIIEYWVYLRDAVIFQYEQSEQGQEYLHNCKRIQQTAPDIDELRKNFKSE